jgi:hypothetical protein
MPRLVDGLEQVFTNLGIVGNGYKLFFYSYNTTTPKDTYSDQALTVPNPNPVVCDATGRPESDIWGSDPSTYKLILATPDSTLTNINPIVTLNPVDNLNNNSILSISPLPVAYWGATTGTSTNYVLNPALVGITSYSNQQGFLIDISVICGASPTININGIGAATLKKYTQRGTKVNLLAGDLQVQRYLFINDGVDIVVLNPTVNQIYLGTPSTLTVSSNAVTITNQTNAYNIDTSSAAQTLYTINGLANSQTLNLGINSASNTLTIQSGTGNIITPAGQNIVLTQITDQIQGYYNGSNFVVTNASTLQSYPSQLIQTQTVSAASQVTFNITSQYPIYEFEFEGVYPSVNGVSLNMQFSTNGGSTWSATSYTSGGIILNIGGSVLGSGNQNGSINLGLSDSYPNNAVSSTASVGGISGTIRLYNLTNASYKNFLFDSTNMLYGSTTVPSMARGFGSWTSTSVVNAVRFIFFTSNSTTPNGNLNGTIKMRGYL